jgi:hypothetical protein
MEPEASPCPSHFVDEFKENPAKLSYLEEAGPRSGWTPVVELGVGDMGADGVFRP